MVICLFLSLYVVEISADTCRASVVLRACVILAFRKPVDVLSLCHHTTRRGW
jgi:hypothetical protein